MNHNAEGNIFVLKAADDAYFNSNSPIISDAEYDKLYKATKKAIPHHVYFTGVGSDVRGGKIDLPYQMGSLDQVYHGEIEDWITKNGLSQLACICTEKLDGTSAMVVYDANGDLQIAYSRGNGVQGADITRHIKQIRTVPHKVQNGPMVVRGEVIISKANFPNFQSKFKRSSGDGYKNARNAVAGIMNSEEQDDVRVYHYVDFVAYEVIGYEGTSKFTMLADMKGYDSFKTPRNYWLEGKDMNDVSLTKILEEMKLNGEYEIDGIVIDVDLTTKRDQMNPTKDTLNPAYSIKYKVADTDNVAIAEVVEVEWNVSKHGYLKPRVNIKPIELVGVTISYATGFNAKFIEENGIGPGAKIQITRSGDVIPFIQKVVEPALIAQMPTEAWEWNETNVDAVLLNSAGNSDVELQQAIAFFTAIEAPHLKEGSITKLFAAGITTIGAIVNSSEWTLTQVLGANGVKIHSGLVTALTDIPLYKLMGAVSTERGIGVRRIKKLQQELGADMILNDDLSNEDIAACDGFDTKTATKVSKTIDAYCWFVSEIKANVTVDMGDSLDADGVLVDKKICMTGFRDKALSAQIEELGGTIQSGVSGKTDILVTNTPSSNSGKAKKARDLGVEIMGINQFKDYIDVLTR